MTNQLEWAKTYLEAFDQYEGVISGEYLLIYDLAKAIIADAERDD